MVRSALTIYPYSFGFFHQRFEERGQDLKKLLISALFVLMFASNGFCSYFQWLEISSDNRETGWNLVVYTGIVDPGDTTTASFSIDGIIYDPMEYTPWGPYNSLYSGNVLNVHDGIPTDYNGTTFYYKVLDGEETLTASVNACPNFQFMTI